MYLFRASQRTDSLHYKDQLFNNVWVRNICLVLKFYKTQKTTAWRKCVQVNDVMYCRV